MNALQASLGQDFSAIPDEPLPGKKSRVAGHEREAKLKLPRDGGDETVPFFDEAKVPVRVIAVPNPEIEGMDPEDYEVTRTGWLSYRFAVL